MNLLDKLRDIKQSVRRQLWLAGMGWIVAALVGMLLILGIVDWAWHIDDRGLRLCFSVAALTTLAIIAWRRLVQPLRWPLSNVALSSHIEQRFPPLRGRLTTAVEFLERDLNPAVGSPELQRRLIEQTSADVARFDFVEVIDRRETQRALLTCALACVVAFVLILSNTAAAATAMQRWLWPLSDHRWPRAVELQLVRADLTPLPLSSQPLRRVQGQPLDLFVVNARGALPQPVLLEFRQPGQRTQSEPLRLATLRDSSDHAREAAAVRLPSDAAAIEFRAIGGDDAQMPWQTLEFVPPAKIESYRVRISPPEYTGESSSVVPEHTSHIRVLLGTRLEISATCSRPIRSAIWHSPALPSSLVGRPANSPAQLNADKPTHVFEFVVTQVGATAHRLALVDRDGFENPSALRFDITGVADPAPIVILESPATDQSVTPNAVVAIQASVKDDRGLKGVSLEHRLERATGAGEEFSPAPALENPDVGVRATPTESPEPPWPNSRNLDALANPSLQEPLRKEISIRFDWPLHELSLLPGARLALRAVAADQCDVGDPRTGRSTTRTLTFVTPETKAAEIANRLDLLVHDLETLAVRQSPLKEQTDQLRLQLEKAGDLRPADRDVLKRAELDQRHIDARLIGRTDGVLARAATLLAELDANQLPEPETRRRLTEIARALDELAANTIPPLEATLSRVVKALPLSILRDDDKPSEVKPLIAVADLQDIAVRQSEVLATLQTLVSDLTQWRDRRELAREIAELAETQTTLNRDTGELAPQTLGKAAPQLTNQQQADLAKLADRQVRQTERLEQLRQRLANSADAVPEADAGAKQTAKDVLSELDQRAPAAKSRAAAQEIAANNLGQASRSQQQLADELKALADKLAQAPSGSSTNATRELQEREAQADELIQQQRQLLKDTREAAAQSESLTPEQVAERAESLKTRQAEVRFATEKLTDQVRSSAGAGEAAAALRRAVRHMQQAEKQIGEKKLADGADQQQEALDDLEQSRRELTRQRQQAQREQLAERAEELQKSVAELVQQQQHVISETDRLKNEHAKAGKWTRPLSKAALSLGEAEQSLAEAAQELAKSVEDVAAVRLTLDIANQELAAAAQRLRNKQLDDETARHEQSALRALKSLAEALAPPKATDDGMPNADRQQNDQNQNDQQQGSEPVPPVAQLKLLRDLQANTRDVTKATDAEKPQTYSDRQRQAARIGQLAENQDNIREATARLLDRVPAPPTDAPDSKANDETEPRAKSVQAMQLAGERLSARDTGEPTQTAQQRAIEQLDALMKLWQQRADRQAALARSGQKAPGSEQSSDKNSTANTDGASGKPTGRTNSQARNSSDRPDTGPNAEAEIIRQRQLREAVWGHLPPALREKMLNLPHDKTLPKYSEHIRRYYEALAEER